MNIVNNTQYALNNSNPVSEFYLWILNHMDLPKIISRLIEGSPKVVFAQFDIRERLPDSGRFVKQMFDDIGIQILESLFGNIKIYRRRKPYCIAGNGYTTLSTATYQIILQFKTA